MGTQTTIMMQKNKQTEHIEVQDTQTNLETFKNKFLKEQQSATAQKVEKMSGLQRIFYGLDYASSIEEVAPLNQEELRHLSREDKKAVKKAHKQSVAKQQQLKKEKNKNEQEKIQEKHAVIASVEAYLKDPEVFADAKNDGMESFLNPNNYVGGEDDAINTEILLEMERIPLEFGLAKKDSKEAAGYTIQNMMQIKELNSRTRYKKWRMRALSEIIIPFVRKKARKEKGGTGQYTNKLRDFNRLVAQEAEEAMIFDRMLNTALADLINHKNFRKPEDTKAKVKKRDYNIEQIHDLSYHHKKAKVYVENYKVFDALYRETTYLKVLKKTAEDKVKEFLDGANLHEEVREIIAAGRYSVKAIEMLEKSLVDNPVPQSSEKFKKYKTALENYVSALKGFSSMDEEYEFKRHIRSSNPQVFEDAESEITLRQKEKEENSLAGIEEIKENELAESIAQLKAASEQVNK